MAKVPRMLIILVFSRRLRFGSLLSGLNWVHPLELRKRVKMAEKYEKKKLRHGGLTLTLYENFYAFFSLSIDTLKMDLYFGPKNLSFLLQWGFFEIYIGNFIEP